MFTQYLSNHSLVTHQIWWTHTRLNKREKFPYWFSCHKVEGKGSKGQTTIDIDNYLVFSLCWKNRLSRWSRKLCWLLCHEVKGQGLNWFWVHKVKCILICWLERHLLVNNFLKLFQNWKGWGLGVGWGWGHI